MGMVMGMGMGIKGVLMIPNVDSYFCHELTTVSLTLGLFK
jgi:hypothetical protein